MSKDSSSSPGTREPPVVPRPSASILLISPSNQILLLHRVQTSSAFPSAHVFPGGNLSAEQDGPVPPPESPLRHVDSEVYRRAAIRECFEESGILLAKKKNNKRRQYSGGGGVSERETELLEIGKEERERVRKEVHGGKKRFADWVEELGGEMDIDALVPFTRWITPAYLPKRFTTQMYIYFLPLRSVSTQNLDSHTALPMAGAHEDSSSPSSIPSTAPASAPLPPSQPASTLLPSLTPSSDGGIEHTTATFLHASTWLSLANPAAFPPSSSSVSSQSPSISPPQQKKPIILFPPQHFLLHLLAPHLPAPSPSSTDFTISELEAQRAAVREFLGKPESGSVSWGDKVISPTPMGRVGDRQILNLERPGPELEGSGRKGERRRVVLARFLKEGVREVEVRWREEVEGEVRREKL